MASSQQGTELPNIKLSNTDPTVGPGVPGIPNQLLIRTDTNEIYYYAGPLDTNWAKIGSGGGGGVNIENSDTPLPGTFSILNFIGAVVADAGAGQANLALAPGNYIVWRTGQAWADVYTQILSLAGQPCIVLVQNDGTPFRTMTNPAIPGPTSLWNVWFIAEPGDGLFNNVTIRTEDGLTLGTDPNGFARLQSTQIDWQFVTVAGPAVNDLPIHITLEGGRISHTSGFGFTTRNFQCVLRNAGELLGSGGTNLVRLLGADGSGNDVFMERGSSIGSLTFIGAGGPHVLSIHTYGDVENLAGTAFGAGVTPVYDSRLHLISPDGTLWTLTVDNLGVLTVS